MSISDGVTVRRAVRTDAKSIARVHIDSWQSTYRGIVPDDYLAKLSYEEREKMWDRIIADPSKHTFLAEAAGRMRDDMTAFILKRP